MRCDHLSLISKLVQNEFMVVLVLLASLNLRDRLLGSDFFSVSLKVEYLVFVSGSLKKMLPLS